MKKKKTVQEMDHQAEQDALEGEELEDCKEVTETKAFYLVEVEE